MVTQSRAMLLAASSVELCVGEVLSADPSEDPVWLVWFWGEVLAMGDEVVGVIEW